MGDKMLEQIDEKSKLTSEGDTAKIKFQSSTNGEAKIEMPENGNAGLQCGLTKEELMKYANDPFWVALRRILLVLFWLLWIALLGGAVTIIIVTPGCPAPKEPEWFESSPVYELRVDKFFDGNGDGKPDLRGVADKLSHLEGISVSTVVLEKLFNPAAQRILQPDVGSFDDFKRLTSSAKVLLKIPLSEVSFDSAQKQRDFATTLDFWLEKGAAGFVFDEIELVSKDPNFFKLLPEWSEVISNRSTEDFPRVTMLSSYREGELDESNYCANNGTFILNYKLTELKKGFTPKIFLDLFERTLEKNRTNCRANFVFSNGDITPLINRVESAERDRIIMFTMLADATPFVYFGEECARNDTIPSSATLLRKNKIQPSEMNWESIEDFSKGKDNNYYRVFKDVSAIRKKNAAILSGETSLSLLNDTVVAMSRTKKKNPGFVVVSNFDNNNKTVNLGELGENIPENGDIKVLSTNAENKVKGKRNLHQLLVGGGETIVLEFA